MKKSVTVLVFALASSTAAVAFACPGGKGGGMARADSNNDGKVSLQEALDAAKRRFEKKDDDKNGVITKDEMKGHGQKFFANFDANNDGKVTLAESQTKTKEWFSKADQNKDGFLTREEMHHGRGPRGQGKGHDKKS